MKEKLYHAILLDLEFKDANFIKRWKELGRKHSRTNPWTLIKAEVPESRLNELIEDGQKALVGPAYYFHAYRDDELVVIFPEKIFKVTTNKDSWAELIKYGLSLGIPEEQLDFKPCKVEDEEY